MKQFKTALQKCLTKGTDFHHSAEYNYQHSITEEFLKTVFDQLVVMCHVVDNSTQTADAALQDLQTVNSLDLI